jgi:hypothetical protein
MPGCRTMENRGDMTSSGQRHRWLPTSTSRRCSRRRRPTPSAVTALRLPRRCWSAAAELSPDPDTQAQRLVAAAMDAPTGQTEWIQDWPPGPCAAPGTGLRLVARRLVDWALAWSSQHAAALSALIPVAREASRFDRLMAWTRSRPRSPTSQGNPRECRRSERPRAARRRGAAIPGPGPGRARPGRAARPRTPRGRPGWPPPG